MKKIVIATIALTLTLTAFADEYARLAAHAVKQEFRGADKDWFNAERFRADLVYKYEAAALAKQQRLLLKKQEELIDVQIELAKEQLKVARNANKVGEKRKNSHDCPEKDNRTDESNRQKKSK